jgi:hypothetical protein
MSNLKLLDVLFRPTIKISNFGIIKLLAIHPLHLVE